MIKHAWWIQVFEDGIEISSDGEYTAGVRELAEMLCAEIRSEPPHGELTVAVSRDHGWAPEVGRILGERISLESWDPDAILAREAEDERKAMDACLRATPESGP